MNDLKKMNVIKILASFLQKPAEDISCTELFGGSEEGTIFKCSYDQTSYVIKFFSNKEAGKNEIAWTQHASDLGIGPKFFYADPDSTYMIMAFAFGSSLIPDIANSSAILKAIAINLAKLHHSSASFANESNTFERIELKYKKLHCSGKLKNTLKIAYQWVKKIEAQFKQIPVISTPCHNDLNWGNIFADNNQVMFIDWGDSALENTYYDIAAFFVLNCINAENEKLFLKDYDFKFLMPQWQSYMESFKQLVHFEFALNLLLGVQAGKKELLNAHDLLKVKHVNHYLALIAKKEVNITSDFLYEMALASLLAMHILSRVK